MATTNNTPSPLYDGYYWLSGATGPEVFENSDLPSELSQLNPTENPFVVEAQYYDKKNNKSISIKYVDGAYIKNKYNLGDKVEDGKCFTCKEYFANRMNDKIVIFRQYWKPVKDSQCEGMDVLQPAEMVFVGFGPIQKEKKDEGK